MAKRTVEESSLTAVADAIRERAGTSDPLVFPEEYESVVRGIPDKLDLWANGTLTEYRNTEFKFPREHGFVKQYNLKKVEYTEAWTAGYYSFDRCTALETVIMPKLTEVTTCSFVDCTSLKRFDCPLLNTINGGGFQRAGLETLTIRKTDGLCVLNNVSAFAGTPIANGTGYIYVPRVLVDSYKAATNWSTYASQFRALEDYTVDGTTTGELDESKIRGAA